MRSYRSLGAWQCAHKLALLVLRVADQSYRPQSAALLSQLRRAAISVEANVVEGYALGTAPLFRRHLRIALGSAAEVECLVNLATDLKYLNVRDAEVLFKSIDETIGVLYGLARSRRLGHPNPP